jgi:phage-related protein
MAFDGTTNCWWPKVPFTVKRTPRLNIAKFGDGYEQRRIDGINATATEWDLKFVTKPDWVLYEMDIYLAARNGASFPFLDPVIGGIVQVFCDEWEIEWEMRHYPAGEPVETFGTLSATFRRAYGVAA